MNRCVNDLEAKVTSSAPYLHKRMFQFAFSSRLLVLYKVKIVVTPQACATLGKFNCFCNIATASFFVRMPFMTCQLYFPNLDEAVVRIKSVSRLQYKYLSYILIIFKCVKPLY